MFAVINGLGEDFDMGYIRMLPTPNDQGVFIFNKHGTYELSCTKFKCDFKKSRVQLQYNRDKWPVVMYIGENLVNCP